MLSPQIKEKISLAVIRVLLSRFSSFPEDSLRNRNAPFHEAFLNAFSDELNGKIPDIPYFISLSSWLHGLSTSLGQSFFENVAHTLSNGSKRTFTNTSSIKLLITAKQSDAITKIITELRNGTEKPSLPREHNLLVKASKDGELITSSQFTADVFIKTDTEIIAVELKTVKPNAGIMSGEKQKMLQAKAVLLLMFPGYKVNFYMGFPFDPNSQTPTGYDKENFLKTIVDGEKYFAKDEILLAGELWEFLSGEKGAMQEILDIINVIATPEFMSSYHFLNTPENRKQEYQKYKNLLQKWFLFSELELLDNIVEIERKATGRNKIYYNNSMFYAGGTYSWNRYHNLIKLIS